MVCSPQHSCPQTVGHPARERMRPFRVSPPVPCSMHGLLSSLSLCRIRRLATPHHREAPVPRAPMVSQSCSPLHATGRCAVGMDQQRVLIAGFDLARHGRGRVFVLP